MSRYYFDLFTSDGPTRDDHGQELSSRERLRQEEGDEKAEER